MNFLEQLVAAFEKLADHLKPNAGATVAEAVSDVEKLISTVLGDIKADLAYLHSRIDQIDQGDKSLANATLGLPQAQSSEQHDA